MTDYDYSVALRKLRIREITLTVLAGDAVRQHALRETLHRCLAELDPPEPPPRIASDPEVVKESVPDRNQRPLF